MIFKITYTENDTINKVCEIEANNKSAAMISFWVDNPEASDISKVEKINADETI